MWILISEIKLTFTCYPIQINLINYQSLFRNEDRFECLYKFTAFISLRSVSLFLRTTTAILSAISIFWHLRSSADHFHLSYLLCRLRHSIGTSDLRLGLFFWLIYPVKFIFLYGFASKFILPFVFRLLSPSSVEVTEIWSADFGGQSAFSEVNLWHPSRLLYSLRGSYLTHRISPYLIVS
jgi:hypothetical protein